MRDKLHNSPTSLLLLLILIDLICTIVWYESYGIAELNPILSSYIEKSSLQFAIVKLLLSLPFIWILYKFKNKILSKIGIAFLCAVYAIIACIHTYIAISVFYFF